MMKKRPILFNFFTYNIIILFIPCIISLVIYLLSSQLIEDHAQKNYLSNLEKSKSIIQSRLKELHATGTQIGLTPSILSLLNDYKKDNGKLQYTFYKVFSDINHYRLTNNLIKSFYLFVDKKATMVTHNGVYQKSYILGTFDEKHRKLIESKLYTYINGHYINTHGLRISDTPMDGLLYVLSLPIGSLSHIRSTLVIVIDKGQLKELLPSVENGLSYVVDSDNNLIIASRGSDCAVNLNQIDIGSISSGESLYIQNKKYVITYTSPSNNSWIYVSVIPEKTVYMHLHNFSLITLIAFSSILIIGLILSFYFANKHAKPITKLVSIVEEIRSEVPETGNEYSIINHALQKLIYNNNDLTSRLEKQMPMLENSFFRHLLTGKFSKKEEIMSYFDYINISLSSQSFIVILLSIQGYDDLINEQTLKEFNMVNVIILDVLENHLPNIIYVYDQNEHTKAILMGSDDTIDMEQLQHTLKQIQELLCNSYYIYISFAVGNYVQNIIAVHQSYNEANKALDYAHYKPNKHIIFFKDLPSDSNQFYYPFELEIELVNALKTGNTPLLRSILETIFKANFVERNLSYDKTSQLINLMKGTIYRQLESYHLTEEVTSLLAEMDQTDSVDMIYNYIIRIHISVTKAVSDKKEHMKLSLKDSVTQYLQENFSDSNLTLFDLATAFDYSEAYMYQFFKDYLGMTYSSYLEKLRIDQACCYIQGGQHSIKDISYMVGYNNDNTFRRAFKRIMGVTPSAFKNATCS